MIENENTQAKHAWDTNAAFWDERMGEGNDFFNILLWPAVEKLLKPEPGERILDVASGNGLTSRHLANLANLAALANLANLANAKASVTAFDGSTVMIALASRRHGSSNIDYRIVDATDREALFGLGPGAFDGALCNMALMDIAEIDPLMNALAVLLKPRGRFVFSVLHPCFNNPPTVQMGELEDRNGTFVTRTPSRSRATRRPSPSWAGDAPVPIPTSTGRSACCWRRHWPLVCCSTVSRNGLSLRNTSEAPPHCPGMVDSVRFRQRSSPVYGAPREITHFSASLCGGRAAIDAGNDGLGPPR